MKISLFFSFLRPNFGLVLDLLCLHSKLKDHIEIMGEAVDSLTEDEVKEYQEIFDLFDGDGRGLITGTKLGQVMRNFGWNPTEILLEVI